MPANLYCRVTPNAKKNEILGWETDEKHRGLEILRLKLKAPPIEGKANRELIRFLAKLLSLPKSKVSLAQGEKSRIKRIAIEGMEPDEIASRLNQP